MSIRFVLGSGARRVEFERAAPHTAKWDEQKKGLRMTLGMPMHGNSRANGAALEYGVK